MTTPKFLNSFIFSTILFFTATIFFAQTANAQVPRTRTQASSTILTRPMADTPRRKVIGNDRVNVNNDMYHLQLSGTADTVWDLKPYLKAKEGCDFEKTVDEYGCILITYTDGFKKLVCKGDVVDVTLPNGKKYHKRTQSMRHEVMRIPAPNPTGTETAYNWLVGYNNSLLSDIKEYLVTDQAFNIYFANEKAFCKGMFYKQIDYRTIFIQEFLKAK